MIFLHYLIHIVLAGIGTLAFSMLFHARKSEYALCAVSGMISWFLYLICMKQFHTGPPIASLISAFMLTLFARIFAAIRKEPVTTYLVTGIFTIVPGTWIYFTSYYLIMDDVGGVRTNALLALKVALAIAIGIVFAFAIPQKLFHRSAGKFKKQHPLSAASPENSKAQRPLSAALPENSKTQRR